MTSTVQILHPGPVLPLLASMSSVFKWVREWPLNGFSKLWVRHCLKGAACRLRRVLTPTWLLARGHFPLVQLGGLLSTTQRPSSLRSLSFS